MQEIIAHPAVLCFLLFSITSVIWAVARLIHELKREGILKKKQCYLPMDDSLQGVALFCLAGPQPLAKVARDSWTASVGKRQAAISVVTIVYLLCATLDKDYAVLSICLGFGLSTLLCVVACLQHQKITKQPVLAGVLLAPSLPILATLMSIHAVAQRAAERYRMYASLPSRLRG